LCYSHTEDRKAPATKPGGWMRSAQLGKFISRITASMTIGLLYCFSQCGCRIPGGPLPSEATIAKKYVQQTLGQRVLNVESVVRMNDYTSVLVTTGNGPGQHISVDVGNDGRVIRWHGGR